MSSFVGRKVVVKERLRKKYRVPELDTKINKQRLLQVLIFIITEF
jgi:tRNA A-37 threonylcarbamoyl transferase component Bud32